MQITSLRERAYEIGRTTQFTETDAMTAAAILAEDYPDQKAALRALDAIAELAAVSRRTMAATAMDHVDGLRMVRSA